MNTIPYAVRSDLADTVEEIGSAMGLLRESANDADAGSIQSAKLCASDALELISQLETKFSEMAATLAIWTDSETPLT